MQAIGRDAVTPDNHSGFWHQRYTLRRAVGSGKQDNAAPGAEGPTQDTPVFLRSLQGAILTTGKTLMAMSRSFAELQVECVHESCWSWSSADPPRMCAQANTSMRSRRVDHQLCGPCPAASA